MKCSMSNCNHHIRRGINSSKSLSESWKQYRICVCCAIELNKVGVLTQLFSKSTVCSQALRLEKFLNNKNNKNIHSNIPGNRSRHNQVTIYE